MWTIPRGLSRMKALREVERAKVDNEQVAREVGELGQLRRIFLYYDAQQNLEVARVLAHSLSKLCSLRSLSIGRWGWGAYDGSMDIVFDLKSPPRLLRYLYINGQITKLPDWVSSLSYLAIFGGIWLRLRGDQLFGVLCELPSLESIKLWKDCYLDQELVARTAHHFPMLKTLSVCSNECTYPKVIRFEEGSMVTLEELTVVFTNNDRRTIVGIHYLTNLKEVHLRGKRSNSSLCLALEELKGESDRRPRANQFLVGVTYD
jgi:disease resistance protein RPM1